MNYNFANKTLLIGGRLVRILRGSSAFAFAQGFRERLRWGDGFGRTHSNSQDWNEAYDRGANLCDHIRDQCTR